MKYSAFLPYCGSPGKPIPGEQSIYHFWQFEFITIVLTDVERLVTEQYHGISDPGSRIRP
jgi:hypothetical protein